MFIPVYLNLGFVAIYGSGTTTSINGITVTPNQFKFGSIYGFGPQDHSPLVVGSIVMFREADVTCRLAFDTVPFTIVEQAKLVITEYYL